MVFQEPVSFGSYSAAGSPDGRVHVLTARIPWKDA